MGRVRETMPIHSSKPAAGGALMSALGTKPSHQKLYPTSTAPDTTETVAVGALSKRTASAVRPLQRTFGIAALTFCLGIILLLPTFREIAEEGLTIAEENTECGLFGGFCK